MSKKNEHADLGFVPDAAPSDSHEDLGFVADDTPTNKLLGSIDSAKTTTADFLKGLGQGATLGFGDELLGGLEAAGQKLGGELGLTDKTDQNLFDLYRKYQQENQQGWNEAKERSPIATTSGEIASGALLAAAGPLGLVGKGAEALSLAQKLKQGAAIGAVAGIGGSEGTVEDDLAGIGKDALVGAGIGAAGTAALEGAGAGAKLIGKKIDDSPLAKKLAATFDYVKNRGQKFTGTEAGIGLEQDLDNTAGSIAKQFTAPMADASAMYKDALQSATDSGVKLSTSDIGLQKALEAARARFKGGSSPEFEALLNKHGSEFSNPLTLNREIQALNPTEAKQLQLGLRELAGKSAYADTTVMSDAERALTPAIRNALPEGELNKINDVFGSARSISEPIVNKGEIDPEFQSKWISDIDTEALPGKMKSYIEGLIRKSQEGNTQGDQARTALKDILDNLRKTNDTKGIQFANPDQIGKQFEEMGTKIGIRKGIVGERSTDTIGKIGDLASFALGSPYRVAQAAGQVAKSVSGSQVAKLGREVYAATDDSLRGLAQKLNQSGLGHMGTALTTALDNKSSAAKNAALFTIMQNPHSRKIIVGNEEE